MELQIEIKMFSLKRTGRRVYY